MTWIDILLSALLLVLAANILAVLVLGGASRQRREQDGYGVRDLTRR